VARRTEQRRAAVVALYQSDVTGRPAGDLVLAPTAIDPDDVADALFTGMAEDRFLILPHPEVASYYQARAATPDQWLENMNHIQQKWENVR